MKLKEFKEALKEYPEDAKVTIRIYFEGWGCTDEIEFKYNEENNSLIIIERVRK